VDFIVGDHTAIEARATRKVTGRDLRGLQAIAEEGRFRRLLLASEDGLEATHGAIRCVPWSRFVEELWTDRLLR
jgi:alkylation response protein AidB-like acyl-CoA dehydrogenase